MSHFTVIVIGDNPEDLLSKYDENLEFDEYFSHTVSDEEKNKFIKYCNKKELDSNKSFSELYEIYGEEWNNNVWREEDGEWGVYTTYNPDSKWDWYQLGGRWTGYFKLKKGAEGVIGDMGAFKREGKKGYVDQLLKKDIDIKGMIKNQVKEFGLLYDKFHKIVNGRQIPIFDEISAKYPDNIDLARKEYWGNEVIKDLKNNNLMPIFDGIEDFSLNKEEYIQKTVPFPFIPFAFLDDSGWYERGEMGWFGCSSNENDNWDEEFQKMFNALPDDTLISLYDCHI